MRERLQSSCVMTSKKLQKMQRKALKFKLIYVKEKQQIVTF